MGLGAGPTDHVCIEPFAKDVQHRSVFAQDLGHETDDAVGLGNDRQALDQVRAKATTV